MTNDWVLPKRRNPVVSSGAGGGTRTHTELPPADFESATSTNSITPAGISIIICDAGAICKQNFWKRLRRTAPEPFILCKITRNAG